MKTLLTLLLLIPSLSWGLTFSNGEKVEIDEENLPKGETKIIFGDEDEFIITWYNQ